MSDIDTERTTRLAQSAGKAFGSMVRERAVMFTNCLRKRFFRAGQVEEFSHVCYIDALRARGTVPAVHAMSLP